MLSRVPSFFFALVLQVGGLVAVIVGLAQVSGALATVVGGLAAIVVGEMFERRLNERQ